MKLNSGGPNIRLIPRLDIKGLNLIKGIHLEGLRVIGLASEYAKRYYDQGADELLYMDCVASLYGRNHLSELIKEVSEEVFIPMTVGGGIRTVEDVTEILRSGADKVAINTAAVQSPKLLSSIAAKFGSQCVVLSIEAKRIGAKKWEVYTDNGREKSGRDVMEWACEAVNLGVGEILITSVDQEGTRKGYDVNLMEEASSKVSVPIIASGGMGQPEHLREVVQKGNVDAVAMADILHYDRYTISDIRHAATEANIQVRHYGQT